MSEKEFCLQQKRRYDGENNPHYKGLDTHKMTEHEKYQRYKKTHKKLRIKNKGKYNFALAVKKYSLKNPEKIKAKDKSKYIKIPEGTLCIKCEIRLAKQRHHEDYSKPLEVIFVCRDCHAELDRLRRIKENAK